MDTATNQIRDLYAKADASGRQIIQEQLRTLQDDLYTDWEVLFGLGIAPVRWALVQIGIDLNIFKTLTSSPKAITQQEFLEKTGAAPTLLQHLLRSMASFGIIEETDPNTYQANRVTRCLSNPHVAGAAPHITDIHTPISNVLPQWLKEHKYQNMNDTKNLPFQKALGTELAPFDFLKQDPVQMKALGHVMVLDAVQSWVDSYPVEKEVQGFKATSDSAVLVDIGGGFGQHSIFFKEKFPHVEGRIVVQDLQSTLAHLPARPAGIDFEEYDFFTPQPIKGAKFYYLRHIMHDWPDEDCIRILKNIIPAMGPDSLILIDDVALPESHVPWQVSAMVMMIMAALGGIERTRSDWESLLDRAGLKVAHIFKYDEAKFHSIVAAVPK
ncbi:S-adenosyl-L-methionine-dependent methyltransferase [Phaeosphaeria sp. MPI-PUGE-AT-0046c]|nr:S-adenosyl-L-methionine-dependent methyltransferase [Phaeosphaeria sp. MPI-PUGE-AT-0046c]